MWAQHHAFVQSEATSLTHYRHPGCTSGLHTSFSVVLLRHDWNRRRIVHTLGITISPSAFTDLDYANDEVLSLRWLPCQLVTPFKYSTKQPGQWECTHPGPRQRFKMSARGHRPPQSPTHHQRSQHRHLPRNVDSSGYSSPDIRRRIGLAAYTMGRLDRVWSMRCQRRLLGIWKMTRCRNVTRYGK